MGVGVTAIVGGGCVFTITAVAFGKLVGEGLVAIVAAGISATVTAGTAVVAVGSSRLLPSPQAIAKAVSKVMSTTTTTTVRFNTTSLGVGQMDYQLICWPRLVLFCLDSENTSNTYTQYFNSAGLFPPAIKISKPRRGSVHPGQY